MKTGAKVAIGVGVGIAALIGISLAMSKRTSAAAKVTPAAPATAASYDESQAVKVTLADKGDVNLIQVDRGMSIHAINPEGAWQAPGVTSSEPSVVAPSIPGTAAGFVAIATGTSVLNGNYTDAQGVYHQQQIVVTVLEPISVSV